MHSRWWHHVLSNGGVSTATSSGCPLSAVVSETSRKSPSPSTPRCTDQLMILQTDRRCRHPGVGTWAPQVGADAGQLWVRGARFIWTARFSLSSGARAAEWSPPCSSSCCTWWSRTSWSAAGCTTGNTEPSRASEPQDLCCAQGVFARSLRCGDVSACVCMYALWICLCWRWCVGVRLCMRVCACSLFFIAWVCYLRLWVRLRAFPNARVCCMCLCVYAWVTGFVWLVVLIMSGTSGWKVEITDTF